MVTYNVHDLVFFSDVTDLTYAGSCPDWVATAVMRAPVGVIRRGQAPAGMLPVGIRGSNKSQRFGAYLPVTAVTDHLTSQEIRHFGRSNRQDKMLPIWQALDQINPYLDTHQYDWGLSGSAAYELVTGIPTVNQNSDLDFIAFNQEQLTPPKAQHLLDWLNSFGPHADVQIMRGQAGFSLEDYCYHHGQGVLVKSLQGPYLSADPWNE